MLYDRIALPMYDFPHVLRPATERAVGDDPRQAARKRGDRIAPMGLTQRAATFARANGVNDGAFARPNLRLSFLQKRVRDQRGNPGRRRFTAFDWLRAGRTHRSFLIARRKDPPAQGAHGLSGATSAALNSVR